MLSLTLNKIRAQRPDLQSAYDDEGKATNDKVPKTIESWWEQYGKTEYPKLGERDMKSENSAIQQFVDQVGKYPTEPHELDLLARIAYDNPPADLLTGQDLPQLGLNKMASFNKAFGPQGAVAGAQEASNMAQPRLDILQDALKKKTGATGAGIGKSKVFEKAGLSGMANLSQSLMARRSEIGNSYERFRRATQDMADVTKYQNQKLFNEADLAVKRYETDVAAYDNLSEQMYKLQQDLTDNENYIQGIELKHKNDIELANLRSELSQREASHKAGLEGGEDIAGSIKISSSQRTKFSKIGLATQEVDRIRDGLNSPNPETGMNFTIDEILAKCDFNAKEKVQIKDIMGGSQPTEITKNYLDMDWIEENITNKWLKDQREEVEGAEEKGFYKGGFLGMGTGDAGLKEIRKYILTEIEKLRIEGLNDEEIEEKLFN